MNEPLGEREVLCVSQFTLYGDTRKGNRPAYVDAARPEVAEPLYERFCERLNAQRGVFGAHMDVELVNDGPVTVLIEVRPLGFRRMPICRFAAEPPQGGLPPEETLQAEFLAACLRVETEEDDPDLGTAGEIHWFPDRTWSGRTYVPATARTDTGPRALRLRVLRARRRAERALRLGRLHARHRRGAPRVADGHLPGGRRRLARRARPGRGDDADLGRAVRAPRPASSPPSSARTPSTRPRSSATASRCSLPTPTTTRTSTIVLRGRRRERAGARVALRGRATSSRCRCCGRPRRGRSGRSPAACVGREEAVALEVERDLLLRLAGVVGVDLLQPLAQRERLAGVDLDVGRLALEAA